MKSLSLIYATAALVIMATSCAKEVVETDSDAAKKSFKAWVHAHYDKTDTSGKGLYLRDSTANDVYIIYDKAGSGEEVHDSSYIFQEYEVRALSDSAIAAYSGESLAKQLGAYDKGSYYGPDIFYFEKNSANKGVADILLGGPSTGKMRVGGTRIALIPAEVSSYSADCVYKITFVGQEKDIVQWQINRIEEYMNAHNIEKEDTTGHKGLYYWRDKAREAKRKVTVPEDVKFSQDTTIYINYIGRHLNGQAFDTNIKDSAKVNGIYSESSSYGPSAVTWSADSTGLKLSGSSVIKGFSRTLWRMHPYESGRGFFISDFGYGNSGNGGVGPYEPLIFEIDIVDKK